MLWKPDILADITLYRSDEGGRNGPTPETWFECPFVLGSGDMHDARLDLSEHGSLYPGESARLPVKFSYSVDVMPKLEVGTKMQLWEGKEIGQATVATIEDDA